MTAHTHAPKAGGASTLLASLSSVQPSPQPPVVKGDFLAAILLALTAHPGGDDNPPTAQSTADKLPSTSNLDLDGKPAQPPKNKLSSTQTPAPDPTTASQWLALLASLPIATRTSPAPEFSIPSISLVPSDDAPTPAPAKNEGENKPAAAAVAEKPQALPASDTPSKEAESKPLSQCMRPLDDPAKPPKESQTTPQPASGTPVAGNGQRMNFVSERHEIAGSMEQKLPDQAISAVSSADAGGPSTDGGAKSPLPFSWHHAPSEPLTIVYLPAKAGSQTAPVAENAVDVPAPTRAGAPLERLEQMITREAVTVRQTGAQTLGVSLKLDSNTRLFLQLTEHNGQVQASVRCERGNFAPEDSQWAQLRQSLASQNVELLPMTGGSNLNFQQPSQEHPRRLAAGEDWAAPDAAPRQTQPRKQGEQGRRRKNWESWA